MTVTRINYSCAFFCALLLGMMGLPYTASAEIIELIKDDNGWKLEVDGEPTPIYGVVYSFTPIGENYSYSLWNEPDDFIKRMLDIDFQLLKDIGVNAIRCFSIIPPRWVEYIYETYGIYTVVNYTFARYGISVDGKWYPRTDYSMPRTREVILEEALNIVKEFKDVKGVLMFMLGNENNYGLEWTSNEIEDLPEGERHMEKARYLYSLYAEAVREIKKLTPIPVGIVNGDIQYIELIAEYLSEMDFLATNTYRGKRSYVPDNPYSTPFFPRIAEVLDKPVLYSEFGADAFNAKTQKEDQYQQALYLKHQWQELFEESYGKDGSSNSLGGFVFEWLDEWWKHKQETELDVHNTEGSWSNGGYWYDFMYEKYSPNNMNEEWFGIAAQSPTRDKRVNRRRPRAAYYMLGEIWARDFYSMASEDVAEHFSNISVGASVAIGEESAEQEPFRNSWVVPSFETWGGVRLHHANVEDDFDLRKEDVSYDLGIALGIDLNPVSWFKGRLNARLQYNALDTPLFQSYEYNSIKKDPLHDMAESHYLMPELYSASFLITSWLVDLEGFYHTGYKLPGHTDWVSEGDFFGILPESFDMEGMDIYYSKAPFGAELTFHSVLEGLKLYGGVEVFQDSRPSILAKYYKGFDIYDYGRLTLGLIHEEELAEKPGKEDRGGDLSRSSSLYLAYQLPTIAELVSIGIHTGIYLTGWEYLGEEYPSGTITHEEISQSDLIAAKGRLIFDFDINPVVSFWTEYMFAGRVAEAREQMVHTGSQIAINGSGNKHEIRSGLEVYKGNFRFASFFLWRTPLEEPLEGELRNPQNSPFITAASRETLQAELLFAYDATGETYFFNFDNDDRENAWLAASLSFLYTAYLGTTDAQEYLSAEGSWYPHPTGLARVENLFSIKGRIVSNFAPRQRVLVDLRVGREQNGKEPGHDLEYNFSTSIAYQVHQVVLKASFDWNVWGPEDWHHEFAITIPMQWSVYVAYYFERVSLLMPKNLVYMQVRGRHFETDTNMDALNTLGSTTDDYRIEYTVGYTFSF